MILKATAAATSLAAAVRSRFFIEADDLVGPAIMAGLAGRPLKFGIIDELRKLGGRRTASPVSELRGKHVHFLANQFGEHDVVGIAEPKYTVQLALKKCGVLMLSCLPERHRKVIMLRYWHQLSQFEVGQLMGFTTFPPGSCPRVSQLETEACRIIARELALRGIRSMRDVI